MIKDRQYYNGINDFYLSCEKLLENKITICSMRDWYVRGALPLIAICQIVRKTLFNSISGLSILLESAITINKNKFSIAVKYAKSIPIQIVALAILGFKSIIFPEAASNDAENFLNSIKGEHAQEKPSEHCLASRIMLVFNSIIFSSAFPILFALELFQNTLEKEYYKLIRSFYILIPSSLVILPMAAMIVIGLFKSSLRMNINNTFYQKAQFFPNFEGVSGVTKIEERAVSEEELNIQTDLVVKDGFLNCSVCVENELL